MHRDKVLELLREFSQLVPEQAHEAERIRAFVVEHPDCFERTCIPGHITGSAWILSHDHERTLLTHHRKLDRWLQLGGHSDGDPDTRTVALREAQEESGLAHLDFLPGPFGRLPIDVDVHRIPARGREPAHLHLDLRFLLVARDGQVIQRSDESIDLRWFARTELPEITQEPSLLRLEQRTRIVLGALRGVE